MNQRPAWTVLLVPAAVLIGCANDGRTDAPPVQVVVPPVSASSGSVVAGAGRSLPAQVRSAEPWDFDGTKGQILRTDHFALYVTCASPAIVDRLAFFAEAALSHYRTALTPLPASMTPMETFVLANRRQWQALALSMMGERARPLVQIRRGGFATSARGFYFDIGPYDTLAVAAHEGWHQFTQATFAETMPTWLEEGLATYMEGHRWEGATPVFLPWANVERFDRLRKMLASNQLVSLQELLSQTPQQLVLTDQEAGVTYYAQLWALVHFLNEGAGGKYRPGLVRAVQDASTGQMGQRLVDTFGARAAGLLARGHGPTVFRAYFGQDPGGINDEYQRFVRELVSTGGRDAIVAGRSPIRPAPAPAR